MGLYDDKITLEIMNNYEDIELEEKLRIDKNETNKLNLERHRAEQNRYQKKRRRKDLGFNLNCKMRCVIWQSLKGNKNGQHWEDLVGYSSDDLIERLKKTIPKDYSWKDFLKGELHIDHIMPISSFDFTRPEDEEFKKCWALENLQLLTKEDNLKKGNKIL